ncbi:hypothetical protein GR925_29075 [Streptomyces sp. HUCO-GS316]|nr:hypothetical protein [Streptomyces sp. HUCO-GS316]
MRDPTEIRDLLARTQPLTRYEPRGDTAPWSAAQARARRGVRGHRPGLRFTHPMTDHKEPRCVSPCS